MVKHAYSLPALILAGCTCTPPAPVVERVHVPASLTAPCVYDAQPETNGELLTAWIEVRSALAECDTRMTSIRNLNSKEAAP